MTVTDQIKIIDNKIKANQAQYDLDRLAAKISAYSSGDLRKYEYLTGEDLGYKPSVIEQAKFEYSPLGKVFNRGLDDKDDQKEGLLKRLRNIEDKNEEQLQLFSKANKISRIAKNESEYNYNSKFAFSKFCKDFENFRKRSGGSKYSNISKFYNLLDEFKKQNVITFETKEHKTRVMNNAVNLYNNYFNFYEKTFDESALNEKEGRDPKQFKLVDNELPKWLELKNDFNEAKRLIDIRTDINKVKVSKEDKKVFDDLDRLITEMSNNRVKKENAVQRLNKSISDLTQLGKKQSTNLQNKMIQVVYQLFNSFGLTKSLNHYLAKKYLINYNCQIM